MRKAYVECGVSQGELATLTGMGESRVQGRCDRGGWTAARKEHQARQRELALKGVDQAALERRRKHEEMLTTMREDALKLSIEVARMIRAPMAVYTERYNAREAARRAAREAGEDDPGPWAGACPVKVGDVNALAQAIERFLDIDLKLRGEPTIRTRNEHAVVDVTELARAIIKG